MHFTCKSRLKLWIRIENFMCRLDTSGDGFLTLDKFKDSIEKIVNDFFMLNKAGDYSVLFKALNSIGSRNGKANRYK